MSVDPRTQIPARNVDFPAGNRQGGLRWPVALPTEGQTPSELIP